MEMSTKQLADLRSSEDFRAATSQTMLFWLTWTVEPSWGKMIDIAYFISREVVIMRTTDRHHLTSNNPNVVALCAQFVVGEYYKIRDKDDRTCKAGLRKCLCDMMQIELDDRTSSDDLFAAYELSVESGIPVHDIL